jgi:putative drug exporter of the RND superfamily
LRLESTWFRQAELRADLIRACHYRLTATAIPREEVVTGFFDALGRTSVRLRWPILVLWLVGAGLAVHFLPSLSSQVNNNNSAFLPASSPSSQAQLLATPFQSSNQAVVTIVASQAGGPLSTADNAAIAREVTLLKAVPQVNATREVGISPDGQAANIEVLAAGGLAGGGDSAQSFIDNLRATFPKAGAPGGLALHTAGVIASSVDNNASSNSTGKRTQEFALIFVIILLLLVFRAALAPFVTLLPAALVVQIASPVVGELAKHGVVQVSEITQLLLIILIIGAGTDYGLFLVFRVREELRAGSPPKVAVATAMARVGESITFSAATVIAAVLCLLLASFGFYHGLGLPLAIGIALMLLAGLTLLPALLAIFGRAVFWPSNVRPGPRRVGIWGRVAGQVIRRPAVTIVVGIVLFGGLAFAVLGYTAGGFAGGANPPAGSDSALGNTALAAHFPKAAANPQNLLVRLPASAWDNPSPAAAIERDLSARPALLRSVIGPLDPNGTPLTTAALTRLHAALGNPALLPPTPPAGLAARGISAATYQAYRTDAQFISADGKTIQFYATLTAGDPQSTAAMNAIPVLRTALAQAAHHAGATASGVAGETAGLFDVNAISNSDLVHIVPIVVLVIGLLLALVLRSLVAPLYLILSVLLSYLAALGLAVLVFIELRHQSGLTFFLPFLMFLFLLALGEDYNILVMTRIREEAHRFSLKEAVTHAVNATGSTVTSAGLVLAGTFAVLVLAAGSGPGSEQFQAIGLGLAFGILMDTFLVRTLLIPSTVVLLGRFNWWPSTLSRTEEPAPLSAASGTSPVPAGTSPPE